MINKLVINKGAIFDYEEIVCKTEMQINVIRTETEKLIGKENPEKQNLRISYLDATTEKMLFLFIKKGYTFGIMQLWILLGICEQCDYSPEMEENGIITDWLNTEIE